MDKVKLLEALQSQLVNDLTLAKSAAQATYEAITHEENKAENEYDTRGLEATYLAHAQTKRIAEIEEILVICKHVKVKNFQANDKINSTALVEVESEDGKRSLFFILAKGGGVTFQFEGKTIQIITPSSPLGEALQGLSEGDAVVIDSGNTTKEFEILKVW